LGNPEYRHTDERSALSLISSKVLDGYARKSLKVCEGWKPTLDNLPFRPPHFRQRQPTPRMRSPSARADGDSPIPTGERIQARSEARVCCFELPFWCRNDSLGFANLRSVSVTDYWSSARPFSRHPRPFRYLLLEQLSEYSPISVRTLECTPPGSPSGKMYATLCICLLRSSWVTKRCTLNRRT
jgi:hypothetical protein